MNWDVIIVLVLILALMGAYLLGNSLIDAYFKRKEKFVDHLQDKIRKGVIDGTGE